MTTEAFDVVIIGAGPSGLATAGHLHVKYGPNVKFVVLEGSDLVGSSWRKRYLRLHLHTPKATSALPYFPYPRNIPTYPSAGQVVDHMREYVKHFDLPVRLRHHVASLEYDDKTRLYKIIVQVWSGDDSNIGGYTGVPRAAATQTVTMTCKAVVMATGCNSVPFTPALPGRDLFKGAVVHSSDYKDGSPYRGQRVLVVGSGNSGGEISVCLSEHGAVPTLLIRRKDLIVITPDDGLVTSLLLKFDIKRQVVPWIKWLDRIAGLITQIKAPNMRAYGIPQIFPGWFGNRGIFEGNRKMDPPFIDVGQCAAIKKGLIKVARGELVGYTPTGAKIGPPTGATGPVTEQEFDAVILCTGYQWAGSITRVLPPTILKKILPSNGKPPGSGVETAQPGLYLIGLEDMIGRLAMIGQEGGAIAESIGQRLGLERA